MTFFSNTEDLVGFDIIKSIKGFKKPRSYRNGVFCGLLLFGLCCGQFLNAAENWVDVILEQAYPGWSIFKEEIDQNFVKAAEIGEFMPDHLLQRQGVFSDHYSQTDANGIYFEDRLIEILNKREGVFIEVGANDGLYQSTTKMLEEKLNWTGILIEPSLKAYEKLCSNRPSARHFHCALGSFEQENTTVFGNFDGDLQSRVGGLRAGFSQIQVPIRPLQSILDEVGVTHIDFFSIDTEGYELNVLKGIDFNRTTFGYILVEIHATDYDSIVNLLDRNGYELVCNFSGYCLEKNPGWTGDHNDYLFKYKKLKDNI